MSSPHHWHVLVPCGAAHRTEIAGGNPQVSLAACTQLWLKAGGCTLTQLLWCGHVQPAVAGSCSRSMWGRSSSVPCHRGAARGSWDPAGTATGLGQGAQPGSVSLQAGEARLYLHSAAYELPSPGSWQLQPDLSRLHLGWSWLLASSNESFNTVLPTCPTLGLAGAVRAAIYLHQHLHKPRQSVPYMLIIYLEFATFQVDTSCFAFATHARVLAPD